MKRPSVGPIRQGVFVECGAWNGKRVNTARVTSGRQAGGRADKQADKQADKRADERADERIDGQTDGQTNS